LVRLGVNGIWITDIFVPFFQILNLPKMVKFYISKWENIVAR
jgi:hypothetical protein